MYSDRFELVDQHTVYYDEEEVGNAGDGRRRRGGTRQTKNIGLMVALKSREKGLIVATTHL